MAWTYQAEYRLGTRGGRVTRTYGGVRALLAIASDLMLGLVFGAIGLVFRVIGWTERPGCGPGARFPVHRLPADRERSRAIMPGEFRKSDAPIDVSLVMFKEH
jgi:hypothetical protein